MKATIILMSFLVLSTAALSAEKVIELGSKQSEVLMKNLKATNLFVEHAQGERQMITVTIECREQAGKNQSCVLTQQASEE